MELPKKAGRPSTYKRDIADSVLERISEGRSLRSVCASDDKFPLAVTFRGWVVDNVDGIAERYKRARVLQADEMADELLEISDDGSNDWMTIYRKDGSETEVENKEAVNRSRLRVETRKWLLAKIHPPGYSEKLAVTGSDGTGPVEIIVHRGNAPR